MSEFKVKEGITRNIDVLGRIVIPIAWRKKYGISTGAKIGVILRENEIILKYDSDGKLEKQGIRIRRIDELGRIVLPKDLRNILELEENDPLYMIQKKEHIILNKL